MTQIIEQGWDWNPGFLDPTSSSCLDQLWLKGLSTTVVMFSICTAQYGAHSHVCTEIRPMQGKTFYLD